MFHQALVGRWDVQTQLMSQNGTRLAGGLIGGGVNGPNVLSLLSLDWVSWPTETIMLLSMTRKWLCIRVMSAPCD